MVLKQCCCSASLKNGSFICGVYTMAFYTLVVTIGSFHLESLYNQAHYLPLLLTLSSLMQIFAALTVLTSVLLIVGLCTDNCALMNPWLIILAITTIIDFITSCLMIVDTFNSSSSPLLLDSSTHGNPVHTSPSGRATEINPFFIALVCTDFLIVVLNCYCIFFVCTYMKYLKRAINRRNQRGPMVDGQRLPTIQFEPASCSAVSVASPRVSVSVLPSARHGILARLAPNPDLICSSFSSTSELSVSSVGSGPRGSIGSSRKSSSGSCRRGSTGSSRRSSSPVSSRRGSALQPPMSPVGEGTSSPNVESTESESSSRSSLNGVLSSGLLRPVPAVKMPSPEFGYFELQSSDIQL